MSMNWKERKAKLRNKTTETANAPERKSDFALTKDKLGEGVEVDWFKKPGFKNNVNKMDFLPFEISQDWYKDLRGPNGKVTGLEEGDVDYVLVYPKHGFVPGSEKGNCVCPKLAFGKPCPVCEERDKLMTDEGREQDPKGKLANSLKPKWRALYNIIDLNGDDKVILWDYSYYLFEKQLRMEVDIDPEKYAGFWDPVEDGKTIKWRGEQKKIGTGTHPFVEANRIDFEDREPYGEEILNETYPLDKMLNILSYEEILSMMMGGVDVPESNDTKSSDKSNESDKNPAKRSRFNRTSKPSNKCSMGLTLGADFGSAEECQQCPEEEYDKCESMTDVEDSADDNDSDNDGEVWNEQENNDPEPEPEPEPRRQRRARR